MRRKKTNSSACLLPFHVIAAAAKGDINAINKVLKHFESYIAVLSVRQFYDEYGNPHLFVDNELRRILETKLILKIPQFKNAK